MCIMSTASTVAKAAEPAGAGYTVADVDTGSSKYSKVYDKDNKDITSDVEYDTSTSKYKKKQTTNAAVDSYAGAY